MDLVKRNRLIMDPTSVADDEWLYRAVRANSNEYRMTEDGLRFSASAFGDRARCPSVDRSSLRPNPADARLTDTNGITRVLTRDVRALGAFRVQPDNPNCALTYTVDVRHCPESIADGGDRDNPAHCQIESTPHMAIKNHYRKLSEALAQLANIQGWIVAPSD